MSARDELAAVIHDSLYPGAYREDRMTWPRGIFVEADAVLAAGYSKPRTITTVEEIRELPALTIVVYDDTATGGPLQTYVVPDDGTVMFKDGEDFHLLTFGGDYIDAKDMPLPLTAVYECGVTA